MEGRYSEIINRRLISITRVSFNSTRHLFCDYGTSVSKRPIQPVDVQRELAVLGENYR